MISTFFMALALLGSAPAIDAEVVSGRVAGTSIGFALSVNDFPRDDVGLTALRKTYGETAVWRGLRQPGDTTVNIITVHGKIHTSAEWRDIILGNKKVGAGLFDIDGTACAEQVRELTFPYRSVGWHAYVTAHDACVDVHAFTTAKGDELGITKDEFEKIVKSVRFAIVRRGAWNDFSERYLELSRQALASDDGIAWLKEQLASAPKDDRAAALALAEHMMEAKADPAELVKAFTLAAAPSASAEKPSAKLVFARALALDGLGVASLQLGKPEEALARLLESRELGTTASLTARAGIAYDLAAAYAANKDVEHAMQQLKIAVALEPIWLGFAARDSLFDAVRAEPAFAEFVPAIKKAPKAH